MAGRPRAYEPQELWDKFIEYKENQQDQTKQVYDKKKQEVIDITYDKPLTLTGFCAYAQIHRDTLHSYKTEQPEYSGIIKNIYQEIEADLLEKALTYDQHANFTMHILNNAHGYVDRKQLEHSGPDGGPIETKNLTDTELNTKIQDLLGQVEKDA